MHGRYDPASCFDRGAWWRASNTPDGPVTTCVAVDARDEIAEVKAWGPGAAWAIEHAGDLLGCGDDGVDDFQPCDGIVRELNRRLPGLRLTRARAVYDIATATIIEQRVTTIESRRTWTRLVRRYGTRAPG